MVKKIILVFKTHVDLGFTDLAENVLAQYAGPMLRRVIRTCRQTERLGKLRYVWTLPAWLLGYIAEHCDAALRPELDRLIESGQIVWHALPFTFHTDLCAPEEFAQGLLWSRRLAEKYHKPIPVAGKMTDVPGHGLMLPELLSQAGVRFLHIGCNAFAAPPQVPLLFYWRSPAGGQVLTMYSKGGYGSSIAPPEDWPYPVWMALIHTHDNAGPQGAEDVCRLAAEARAACPQAEIECGTMDGFYRALAACDLSGVPVIGQDLADTWIHGVGSCPAEVSRLRENRERARRLHQLCYVHLTAGGRVDPALWQLWERYYEQVCLFEEHTWGADVKTWLGAGRVYEKAAFAAARATEPYRFMERSWNEQRRRVDRAGALLDEIGSMLPAGPVNMSRPAGTLTLRRSGGRVSLENHRYRLSFDERSGRVEELYDKRLDAPLLRSQDGQGVFSYRYDRYGSEDITEYLRSYAYRFTTWGIQDNGRDSYPECARESYEPVFERYELSGGTVRFFYAGGESAERYGDCRRLTLEVTLPAEGDAVELALTLHDKQATAFVESGSLIFPLAEQSAYRVEKPCAVVDIQTQIADGANHVLHNVEREVTAVGESVCVTVCPLDTPLFAVGSSGIFEYQKSAPAVRRPQLWFDLFNTMWGTNFPQWIEGNFRFRFMLWGSRPGGEDSAPAKAAAVLRGPEPILPPGVPADMELVHTRVEDGTLYITLRDHGGVAAEKVLRAPGARIAAADLLGRVTGECQRDEMHFQARPYGLSCFALTR